MYYRSYDSAGDPSSGNMDNPATVSSLRLDKYEATVRRFRTFVQAGMGTQSSPPPAGAGAHAKIGGSGWDASWNTKLVANTGALIAAVKCNASYQTWTDTPGANEDRPMSCLTWYEAMAFCAWDGGYLPTEAEWNYAATGGDQQRAYPWSSPPAPLTVDASHASYNDGTNCVGDGMPGCAVTDLVPVGTKPAGDGRWGQSDLAGNVAEWTLDWQSVYPNPCTDCADLTTASDRVTRGGNFGVSTFYMRTISRSPLAPANRSAGVGVRCARAL
jgi:formylglycine-generating enzyme required for sulfatase activity